MEICYPFQTPPQFVRLLLLFAIFWLFTYLTHSSFRLYGMCVKMLSSIVTVVIIITQLLCTSLQQSLSHSFWQHWFYGHQLWLALLLQPSVYFISCQQHYCSHHESLSLFFLNNTNIKSALFAYETHYKTTLSFI